MLAACLHSTMLPAAAAGTSAQLTAAQNTVQGRAAAAAAKEADEEQQSLDLADFILALSERVQCFKQMGAPAGTATLSRLTNACTLTVQQLLMHAGACAYSHSQLSNCLPLSFSLCRGCRKFGSQVRKWWVGASRICILYAACVWTQQPMSSAYCRLA